MSESGTKPNAEFVIVFGSMEKHQEARGDIGDRKFAP